MSLKIRFESAASVYREQILAPIGALAKTNPFAAVTLACCAIDLLSHTLYNPDKSEREEAYIRTVKKKLVGYNRDGVGQQIYWLRSGLVHEFRTGNQGCRVFLTDDASGVSPEWRDGKLIVVVTHFCEAVRSAFQRFFEHASDDQRRAFTERAFVYVVEIERLAPRPDTFGGLLSVPDGSGFGTQAASGTVAPTIDRRFERDD